jgi:hypothetical protein
MNIERLVASSDSKEKESIYSSTHTRENVIYLEGKYCATNFSICQNNKMIILRNDNKIMLFWDISNENYSEIVISQSTQLGFIF